MLPLCVHMKCSFEQNHGFLFCFFMFTTGKIPFKLLGIKSVPVSYACCNLQRGCAKKLTSSICDVTKGEITQVS